MITQQTIHHQYPVGRKSSGLSISPNPLVHEPQTKEVGGIVLSLVAREMLAKKWRQKRRIKKSLGNNSCQY